jgi:NhaP-type Na+/H+ or K+/H+ antiporter/Trk K+ transport system NAD-binding subunit
MHDDLLFGITTICVLGIFAQWLGWKLKIPAILLLLGLGFVVGPGLHWINPDAILGNLLFPLVSLAVSVILFEGGLSLNLREIKKTGGIITRFCTLGIMMSFALTTATGVLLLDVDIKIACLMGMILVVTGPTVIGPMLRAIRPKGELAKIVKWESILGDPIGAIGAVLIFEFILQSDRESARTVVIDGILRSIATGIGLSALFAWTLCWMVRMKAIPDYLMNVVTLMFLLLSFTLSNHLQSESGLLTVTLFGIFLANQQTFSVKRIMEFKENLQVLLLSIVFIILAARVDRESFLDGLHWSSFGFLLMLIIVIRPAAVLASTIGSKLKWKERVFFMLMAPRGIVVAAVTSLFTLKLEAAGYPEANLVLTVMLMAIVGTVTFYGLMAGPISQRLGISNLNPEGILFLGAHEWSLKLAVELRDLGVSTILIDSKEDKVKRAKEFGLNASCGNVFSDRFIEKINFSDVGHVIACTPNDEVNAFAEVTLREYVDPSEIYHVTPSKDFTNPFGDGDSKINHLFSDRLTFIELNRLFENGSAIRTTEIPQDVEFDEIEELIGKGNYPLFLLHPKGKLLIFNSKNPPSPEPGDQLIYLLVPGVPQPL